MSATAPMISARTNTLAVVALILGLVFPLAAIPVGHIARRQITQTGERGDGLAIAGLILGYLGLIALLMALGGVVALLVWPS
jgi:hypothetical protein